MNRAIVVASLLALGATAAVAQSNILDQREALMKENAAQTRTLGGMLRGQAPFNLSEAQASLKVLADNAGKIPDLFPASTKDAPGTEALPAIWENKEKFNAIAIKMQKDAQAALANVKDEASFKAQVPQVLQSCGACHNDFRKKSS